MAVKKGDLKVVPKVLHWAVPRVDVLVALMAASTVQSWAAWKADNWVVWMDVLRAACWAV